MSISTQASRCESNSSPDRIAESGSGAGCGGCAQLKREDVFGHFQLQNVTFCYQMRPKEKVLNGISLDIDDGATVAFVGKADGDKATRVQILM